MEKSLVCQLLDRTAIGYRNAENKMREYLYSKLNTEIKETMFQRADNGYNNVGFSIDFHPSCLLDEEVKKIFIDIIIEEGFDPDDIQFTGHWVHGFSGYISWRETNK
jgi:hypothetical protein